MKRVYQFDSFRFRVMHFNTGDRQYEIGEPNYAFYVKVANSFNGQYRTEDGRRVDIASVNGIGELRWWLMPYQQGAKEVMQKFNVTPW